MLKWIGVKSEYLFTIFAFSIYAGAYVPIPQILVGTSTQLGDVNPWNMAAQVLSLIGSSVLVYRHINIVYPLIQRGAAINALMLLCLASIFWSFDPIITAKRDIILVSCLGFAYYMVARYDMIEVIHRLGISILSSLIISAFVSVLLPSIGSITPTHPGSWNGVFIHKNVLGWATVLCSVVYAWRYSVEPNRRIGHALTIIFILFIAVMSQSKTGLLGSIIAIMLYAIMRYVRIPGLLRLWIIYVIILMITFVATILGLFWTEILTALGRDPSLTGRIPIWSALIQLWTTHFFLGYGYSAFWIYWNPDAQLIWSTFGWTVPEAHNAYIDMAIQLGAVGLALSIWILLGVVARSFHLIINERHIWSSFIFVYSASLVVTNMTETMLFRPGDIHCALLSLCYLAIVKSHSISQPCPVPQAG
jgi:O-antigen ligase